MSPNDSENTELVIGLVGAVGTDLKEAREMIAAQLARAGYVSETIKISKDVISRLSKKHNQWNSNSERYNGLMDAGNAARRQATELENNPQIGNAVLANVAAALIHMNRDEVEQERQPSFKKAYFVESLKRKEEVDTLRSMYPQGFVLVGVFEDENLRVKNLCGHNEENMTTAEARALIERDAAEEKEDHGQRVRDTYHLADFFVRVTDSKQQLECDVRRMVEIWFGNPFLTPTFDEYAMYFAFASALRSADLSRQVGAVIARNNQILSTGANECPQGGGGLYWPQRGDDGCVSDTESGRDFMRGEDSNRIEQIRIIDEVLDIAKIVDNNEGSLEFVQALKANGITDPEVIVAATIVYEERIPKIDFEMFKEKLERSSICDLTEYGRVVHAEMEALLACARNQISTLKATVYCTTFPCHNCAKHIVAAGVSRVVYIEPYTKSKALPFHTDSIKPCGPETNFDENDHRVVFQPFVGIGPRKFFELFSMKQSSSYDLIRKDKLTGKKQDWHIKDAELRLKMYSYTYLDRERGATQLKSVQAASDLG